MNPAIFRSMTAKQASAFSQKTIDRIRKREARLSSQGIETNAMAEFRELREAKPQTRNEEVSRARRLAQLDQSPGLRASTAAKAAKRDARANLIRSSENHADMMRMSRQELETVLKAKLRSVEGKASRVEAQFERTHATTKYREFLKTMKPEPTYNQLRSYVSQINRIDAYEGINVKGAKVQENRGVEWFGEKYRDFSKDEQNAVWNEVYRMVKEDSISSPRAAEIIAAYIRGDIELTFSKNEYGNTVASFGTEEDLANVKAAKDSAMEKAMKRIMDLTSDDNPMGPWAPM